MMGAITLPAGAQSEAASPLTLESVTRLAVREDSRIVELERSVADARDALEWPGQADDVALSLTGGIAGATLTELSSTAASATLGAGMELLPQLSVSGSLAATYNDPATPQSPEPLSASVELTLRPFADAQGRNRDRIALERAQVNLAERGRAVALQAVDALLNAVEAEHALELAVRDVDVTRAEYTAIAALAERDRASREEVEAAADARRAAAQSAARRRLASERAQWELARLTGLGSGELPVPGWDALELGRLVDRARRADPEVEAFARRTADTLLAELTLESARVEFAGTYVFTPELSATAGVSLSSAGDSLTGPGYSLGVSVVARASDWDGQARRRREEDIALAEQTLDSTIRAQEYALRAALLELSIAIEDLAAAEHDAELAHTALAETRFRYDRGEVSPPALHRRKLIVDEAEYNVHLARATVARRWYTVDLLQF